MGNRAERFRLGSWVVVPARGLIRSNGSERRLTPQQMEVLVCLARRAGEIVSKNELLEDVWNGAIVEEGGLARCVSELRSALGDDARAPKYIQTVAGRGYRLITEPEVMVEVAQASRDASPGRSRWRWVGLGAILAVLVLTAILKNVGAFERVGAGRTVESDALAGSGPVVAVLGFRNLSGDSSSDWLSTAMPELLANELAVSDEVRVVPAQSVSRLTRDLAIPEGETLALETLRQVKAALGVDFVVLGSFLSVPGQVAGEIRLDAQFQDTATAEVMTTWTDTVAAADILSALSRAGLFLRQALGVQGSTGSGPDVAAYLPKSPTALRLYYQGVRALRHFEVTAARDYLSRSLALEPDQPFALLALSQAWAALGYDAKAVEIAQSALGHSVGLPREYRLLVEASFFAVSSKWSDAIERYRALWLLAPDNLDYAVQLARSQNSAGQPEEALATLKEIRLPDGAATDPRVFLTRAESATRTGDHENALGAAREAADRAQLIGSSLMLARARQAQAVALSSLGHVREAFLALDEARNGFSKAGDYASEAGTLGMEADWAIMAGNPEQAQEFLARALAGFREVGNRRGEAETLTRLGQARSYQGDLVGARRALTEAISTFLELEDRFGQATALFELAYAMGSNGQPQEAELPLREAAKIFESIGALEQAASVQSVLGMTLFVTARPAEGHEFLKQAEATFLRLGSKYELGRVWNRMASSFWCLGELASAEESARKAREIGAELGNPRIKGFALVRTATIHTEKGLPGRGIEAATAALQIADEQSMPGLDVAALARLVEASLARLDTEGAVLYAEQAVDRATATSKYVVGAYDSLARALIAAGDYQRAMDIVALAAAHDDGFSDVSIELALSRLRLQMREAPSVEHRQEIARIINSVSRHGHWVLEMDARLALGELEAWLGNLSLAQATLEQVIEEAEKKSWVTLGAKGRRVLASHSLVNLLEAAGTG